MNIEGILGGLDYLFQVQNLVLLLAGVIIGTIVGALPGMGASLPVALLLPVTYTMRMDTALMFLMAIFCGSMYGGSISAILFNVPGTGSAAATALDGYPLAEKGRAGDALTAAVVASFVGTCIGTFALLFFAPPLASAALSFGPPEYCVLGVFGLTIIATLAGKNIIQGAIGGCLGLLASCIGMDSVTGTSRFAFDQIYLYDGINLVWMVVGLFGVSQSFKLIQKLSGYGEAIKIQDYSIKESVKLVCKDWKNMIRSGIVGTIIGAIPGTGGSVANWVSYDLAKRFSKHPEEFGKGTVAGVNASEAANNGVCGGALIPTLTLGIPGSEVTAILLGGMLIAGIDPGPNLFIKQAEYMYSLTFSLFLSGLMFLFLGLFGAKYFAKVLKVPNTIFAPMIICLASIGAYSVKQQFYGIVIMFVIGVIAYFLKNTGFPLPPMLIGLILGPIVESNLNRSLIMSHGSWNIFLTRPICLVFLALALASIVWAVYQAKTCTA